MSLTDASNGLSRPTQAMHSHSSDPSIPPLLQRRLHTLGHGLFRLGEAWRLLDTRLKRGLLDEAATTWINRWCGDALPKPLPLPVDSTLAVEIAWAGSRWQVAAVAEGKGNGGLADPWAAALVLLHLPALREFWRRALRAQRFARLSGVLPKVWALDTQELRPGAVIAGAGISTWRDLPRLMAAGRVFEVLPAEGGQALAVEPAAWPGILAGLGDRRLLLREKVSLQPEGWLAARWKRNEAGRIVLDEA